MTWCVCVSVSGQSYGCVVKKKVIYLEEMKRGTPDFGSTFNIQHFGDFKLWNYT